MRIATFAGILSISGSLLAVAQGPAPVQQRIIPYNFGEKCPLDMHVRQGGLGQMIATDKNGARVKMFAAKLKLLLSDTRPDRTSQRMAGARVTVLGWNGKEQVLPIGATRDPNSDLSKMSLTVSLTGGSSAEASGDLLLPGFTAARTVQLESITYADGQVWTFQGPSACQVVPDMFMPVNGKD